MKKNVSELGVNDKTTLMGKLVKVFSVQVPIYVRQHKRYIYMYLYLQEKFISYKVYMYVAHKTECLIKFLKKRTEDRLHPLPGNV